MDCVSTKVAFVEFSNDIGFPRINHCNIERVRLIGVKECVGGPLVGRYWASFGRARAF